MSVTFVVKVNAESDGDYESDSEGLAIAIAFAFARRRGNDHFSTHWHASTLINEETGLLMLRLSQICCSKTRFLILDGRRLFMYNDIMSSYDLMR